MENIKRNKYEYLSHPCLLDSFKQKYLSSLNIFLNDDKYLSKIDSLPLLKSSSIVRFEKEIEKKQQEKEKMSKLKEPTTKLPIAKSKSNAKLKSNKIDKTITIRYIVMDHEFVEITLSVLEESNECNSKLDPFHAYFIESNEKMRRKALEQIITNIIPKTDKEKRLESKEGNVISILSQEMKSLERKYPSSEEEKKEKRLLNNLYKAFDESCNNHSIISLDQRIDYFVHLKKIGYLNSNNNNPHYIRSKLPGLKNKLHHNISENKYDSLKKNSISNNEIIKYPNDLKQKFKIIEDYNSQLQWETFEKDLETKIRTFISLKNVLKKSNKFLDKIRIHLNCQEVQIDQVILRQCEITSDLFYYLTIKHYFDFNILRHLNLSRNPLGDIGGCYLFTLIETYGVKFDYLNVSYTKIGKQTNDILVNILKENKVKIISLSIGGNALGDKLFSDLCIGISKNIFLTKLFINHNELGKISSVILGTILKYDKKIKCLDVSKNLFGDEHIGYMMKGLICNTSLETLMINDMLLTNRSLRVFETTLCINTSLKELFLERNKLHSKGWRILSDILNKNKHIEYLSLVGNNFESDHFDMISEQQRQVEIKVINKIEYLQFASENNGFNLYEYIY